MKKDCEMRVVKHMLQNDRGFTIVEMIVVTALFVIVIIMTGSSFNAILMQSRKLMQSEENNIEGIIGLEMMRHDLEQAGFGLPWVSMESFNSYDEAAHPLYSDLDLPDYKEAATAPHKDYNDGIPNDRGTFTLLNGTTTQSRIPRAVVTGDNLVASSGDYGILADTDYLAIKATSVGGNDDSKRWTYINYSGTSHPSPRPPNIWLNDNINSNAGVIITRREIVEDNGTSIYAPMLIYDPADTTYNYFYQPFPSPGIAFPDSVSPLNNTQIYYVYGVGSPGKSLSMPFNRVNYFVAKPADTTKIPKNCAPNAGILYRATVNHSDNGLTYAPVLDCVADMQLVLGFNFDGTGTVNVFSDAGGDNVSDLSGAGISSDKIKNTLKDANVLRDRLKIVKVYVLAQEGRRDPGYVYRNPNDGSTKIVVGGRAETSLTKSYDLAANNALNYHWKVYQITARPKNLMFNQ